MDVLQLRYLMAMELADSADAPYELVAAQLQWVNTQDLLHARAGFNFWYGPFQQIPSINALGKIDEFIAAYIIGDSEHHCTNLNTVGMAMKAFTNALRNRHHVLCQNALFPDPSEAIRLAMFGPDERWNERIGLVLKQKGIVDLDAYTQAAEQKHKSKLEQIKKHV